MLFEPNKEYVLQVIADQLDVTSLGTGYVWDAHKRFEANLAAVTGDAVPSEQVIEEHREKFGREYRLETEGPHPTERQREPAGSR